MRKCRMVLQHDENDCAAACLSMIASQYKIDIPLAIFHDAIGIDENGGTVYGIVKAAQKYGIKCEALGGDFNEFIESVKSREIEFPLIANILSEEGFTHFIVISKSSGKKFEVLDPANGKKIIKYEQLEKMWLGTIIVFEGRSNKECIRIVPKTKEMIRELIKSKRKIIIALAALSFAVAILDLTGIVFIQQIITHVIHMFDSTGARVDHRITTSDNSALSQIIIFIDQILHNFDYAFGLLIFTYVIQFGIRLLQGKYIGRITKEIDENLVLKTYNHMIHSNCDFFDTRRSGEIMARFFDMTRIRECITQIITTLFSDFIFFVIYTGILYYINHFLFVVIFIVLIIYGICIYAFSKPIKRISTYIMNKNAKIISYIKESIHGIYDIKIYKSEVLFFDKMKALFCDFTSTIYKGINISVKFQTILKLISSIGFAVVLWIGSRMIVREQIDLSGLIVFYLLIGMYLEPLKNIMNLQNEYQNAAAALDRLDDLLENNLDTNTPLSGIYPSRITFSDVSFSYKNNCDIITKLNFEIQSGSTISIIGKTGSGKSTIAKMIMGLILPKSGEILLDNKPINSYSDGDIREAISYVHEDNVIFSESIYSNIVMNSKIEFSEYMKICDICLITDFVKCNEEHFSKVLTENGACLSQGEKQRIFLARALASKPKILIMDEATNHLDIISERKIIDNICKNYVETTIIFITHRLPSVLNSDMILVMNNGNLVGKGTHDELYGNNEMYTEYIDQFKI